MLDALDTNAFYAFGIPAYVVVMAFEHWLSRRRGKSTYQFADTLGNASAGLGEVVVGLFLGPLYLRLYEFGHTHLELVHWPEGSLGPWVLAFFAADLGYYLGHRVGHEIAALWAIHGVHHQSEQFNISVATRHPWFSDVYSVLFYAHVPLLGITSVQFFVAISCISFYALFSHSLLFDRPGFWLFVTPRTHLAHHCQNARYIGKNLGAMFTLWDRLFGTYVEVTADDPPILGTRAGYRTHDGAWSQWIGFRDLVRLARQTPRWRDKWRVWLKRPGWVPPGARSIRDASARTDAEIPLATKVYTGAAFALLVVFSTFFLWFRQRYSAWTHVAVTAFILASLSTLGGLLDGRRHAVLHEAARVLGALGLVLFFVLRA
jgi:alkylglycerol monooxygenase